MFLFMRRLVAAAAVAGAAACGPGRATDVALTDGRTYTAWLFQGRFDQLWQRFSPEMRRTFTSAAELAAFADHTVGQLGAERGTAEERLSQEDTVRVYTHAASYEHAPGRVLVQWTLDRAGAVTGLFIRPEPHSTQ
jgi:hypothetical protein